MKNFAFIVFVAVVSFEIAFAQSSGLGTTGGTTRQIPITNPISFDSAQCVLNKIIDILFVIAAPISAVMVLVGGFMMTTAGGNPEQFSKGTKTILYAAIGFVVILAAKGIVQLLANIFSTP